MPAIALIQSTSRLSILAVGLAIVSLGITSSRAHGQTIYSPGGASMVQPGVTTGPPVDIPQTNLTPIAPPTTTYAPPPNGYGSFDPYSSTPASGAGGIPGVTSSLGPGVTTIGPPAGGYPTTPSSNGSLFGLFSSPTAAPMAPAGYGTQTMAPINNPPIYGPSPYDVPPTGTVYGQPGGFPNSAYPQSTPSSLFPEGFGPIYSGSVLQTPIQSYSAFRLLQGPRFRYTYVTPSSEPDNLGINDFDFSLAFAFPNFLHCTQPLFVIPSFSLHLWDGPNNPVADLPPNAYSAFVDMGWESDPNKLVGTELGLRMGVFTDFNTYNSNSFMIRGSALATFRVTPTSTFKTGIFYPNRNEVKLVPAFGFFCRPNPFTRLDLFFPNPRYARYCRTLGTNDLWWYVTGEYGGGNWTIERAAGYSDQVDINDLRAILGFEWGPGQLLQAGRRTAFAEFGWVFSREIRYRYSPQDDIDIGDGFMFRIGFGY